MPYSEAELDEIGGDPARLRAYWWLMAMHHKRLAREYRARSRAVSLRHPTTNYLPAFEDGEDDIRWADTLDRVSDAILENIDDFVSSTLKDSPAPAGES